MEQSVNNFKIYATYYNKPEFIELQYTQFKKYCKDKYELIIINNGIDSDTKKIIKTQSEKFKLPRIEVNKRPDIPEYCSQNHTVCLEYVLNNYIKKDDISNTTVILDNDVFPFREFSFLEIIKDKKACGMYQQRNCNNLEHEYLASIFMMFNNDIDMSNFSFHNGIGDTGSGTFIFFKKYDIELTKHTAAIDIEKDYIFTNKEVDFPYLEKYRCQFISDCFIHYYRGCNWSESDPSYHKEKFEFLINFLENPDSYKINLDDYVSYSTAHSDKGYNGIDHNYRNYKFLKA